MAHILSSQHLGLQPSDHYYPAYGRNCKSDTAVSQAGGLGIIVTRLEPSDCGGSDDGPFTVLQPSLQHVVI